MTFTEFCQDLGVIIPLGLSTGRWHRVPTVSHPRKKNASVKISEDQRVGWVQDWATMEHPVMWKLNGDSEDKFVARVNHQRIAEDRLEAIERCREFWSMCRPLSGPTEYLVNKHLGVEACAGIRRTEDGRTVIPMYLCGEIASVQVISPDGEKRFWKGAPTKGACCWLKRKYSTVTILCEGFATGATLYEAIPDASVLVGFSAANLPLLAHKLKSGWLCVAADNDHETEARIGKNPGVQAARDAASLCGAGVAIPDVTGTDWNDRLAERLFWLNTDNSLSKFKRNPKQIRQRVLAEIRQAILREAKFKS